MASSDEQSGANYACANSSDDPDTPPKITAASDEPFIEDIDDKKQEVGEDEIDVFASNNITQSIKEGMGLEGIEEPCNEFTTKTWKDDLTVIVNGNHLYVSSGVLALMSPVFSTMVETVFKNDGPRILELTDNYEEFVEFLRYIYPSIIKTVTEENALMIVSLAHKYQVKNIEDICKSILLDMVCGQSSPESLTSIFNSASSCELTSLRDKCMLEMTRRKIPDTELNQLGLSSDVRHELKTTKIRSLEKEVQTLKQSHQQKSDRCDEFEYLVTKTWLEDLEITTSAHVELHMTSINVSAKIGADGADPVCFKNMTWTLEANQLKKTQYPPKTYLVVILSAQGDRSWRQWRCKVKASCSVFDGYTRLWKQSVMEMWSSNNKFKFEFCLDRSIYLPKPLKVSVIFAVGNIIV